MNDGTAVLIDALRRRGGKISEVRPGHWRAQCPAHDDRNPSLHIDRGADGKPLIRCFAECETESVLNALGLKWPDILGDRHHSDRPACRSLGAGSSAPAPSETKGGMTLHFKNLDAAAKAIVSQLPGATPAGQWVYTEASGAPVFAQLRFDLPERDAVTGKVKKTFRIMRKTEKGWGWGKPGGLLTLYRLPDLLARPDETVFVVEGEKTADAAAEIGLLVTTSALGAGKSGQSDWSPLADRKVVILPDNDAAGKAHTQDVAGRLADLGCEVRIVELPGLPEKGDIVEWLSPDGPAGSMDAGEARKHIEAMAKETPSWRNTASVPRNSQRSRRAEPVEVESAPVVLRMSDVAPQPVKWLWPSRIALGKLTIIAGDPGLGKSFLTLDMAARVSTGTGWPDAPEVRTAPGGVVLLSAEDDPADTIRPRLDAAYADVSRIVVVQAVRETDEKGNVVSRCFSLDRDIFALDEAIRGVPDCRLVIVDPISAYLGDADSHKNAEVRAVLAPLNDLAVRRGVAMLAVTHLRKGEGAAIYRAMGSLAFVAAARAVFAVTRDQQDESGERRLFLPVKNNIGNDRSGFAYRIIATDGEAAHVAWERDPVNTDVDEALARPEPRRGRTPDTRDQAAEWLKGELADGPRASEDLFEQAKAIGIAKGTLWRAKKVLGIKARKVGLEAWEWFLPAPCEVSQISE
jgi:hypothetical protein